jgi:ABC-type Fe3+/spermidine/putrescine transport system ATPase subunit
VDDALALVQLSGYGKRMPAELSGGSVSVSPLPAPW